MGMPVTATTKPYNEAYKSLRGWCIWWVHFGCIVKLYRGQAKVNELCDTSSKKTVTELAKEVIAGKWGNGTERKKKLTEAGYDYSAVQKKVNKGGVCVGL